MEPPDFYGQTRTLVELATAYNPPGRAAPQLAIASGIFAMLVSVFVQISVLVLTYTLDFSSPIIVGYLVLAGIGVLTTVAGGMFEIRRVRLLDRVRHNIAILREHVIERSPGNFFGVVYRLSTYRESLLGAGYKDEADEISYVIEQLLRHSHQRPR